MSARLGRACFRRIPRQRDDASPRKSGPSEDVGAAAREKTEAYRSFANDACSSARSDAPLVRSRAFATSPASSWFFVGGLLS